MNDILCIELDLVSKTGGKPVADEGPMSRFGRTGRWTLLKEEGLDRLSLNEDMKAIVLKGRKVFLMSDAFTDFFGKETQSDQVDVVRVQEQAGSPA